MGQYIFEALRGHFTHHGYLTVMLALLLENTGVPVPGETILLFASFLAYSQHELRLPFIIVSGIIAATLGDNAGYLIGHFGGRPLLERWKHLFHVSDAHVAHGEKFFQRHGHLAIFFARFVFGMRIIAGPLAGVLRMPWKQFVIFNFLGAALWVTVISCVGYFFGSQWQRVVHIVGRADLVIVVVVIVWAAFAIWHRRRERRAERAD